MVFSSSVFLFAFLPVVLLVYYFADRRFRNYILLFFSVIFYAWGEPVYVVLMLASIVVNWLAGMAIGKSASKKAPLVIALVVNLAILGFFKYEGFLANTINALVGMDVVPNLDLPLPIGISFYTLQAISYLIDVYRGDARPQRNMLYLGMYIAMFPQLVAGPIVRYQTIEDQIMGRKENLRDFASGARLFSIGLAKKVLLANNVAILANQMLASQPEAIGAIGAWGGLVAYTFQIFFDFSGYSDMAIGLGKMFGFKYLRNFNYPYISKSITEFWRRWHISLSTFFRDYIYIPLGGNRVPVGRWMFNIAVVWALTGLWHGAAWNFVIWGVYYGAILIFEKLFIGRMLDRAPSVLRHVYTMILVMFGWCFFWIGDPSQLFGYLQSLIGFNGALGSSTLWELNVWHYLPLFAICAVASTPVVPWLRKRVEGYVTGAYDRGPAAPVKGNEEPPEVELHLGGVDGSGDGGAALAKGKSAVVAAVGTAVDVCLLGMLLLSVFSIVSGSYNPFIYFQF